MNGAEFVIFNDCTTNAKVNGLTTAVWQRTAGAYRIATELRNRGYVTQVIDHWSFLLEEPILMAKLIEKFVGSRTIAVAFSSTFMSRDYLASMNAKDDSSSHNAYSTPDSALKAVVDLVKQANPKVDIILAGARAHYRDPLKAIKVVGYGEMHIVDYLSWKQRKNIIAGATKAADGAVIFNTNSKADGFDFARSSIDWHERDCIQPGEVLPIEISRGCIFRCKFCAFPLNGKSKVDYLKDIDVLEREMLSNFERFGTTMYMISDDTYNDTTEKLVFINELRRRLPFNLQFATYVRLDLLVAHPEQAELMLENGLIAAFFGIESLNHAASKAIGKGLRPERGIEMLHKLRADVWKHNVHTSGGFIVGLPHDTYPLMERWLDQLVDGRFPLHSIMTQPLGIIPKPKVGDVKTFYSEFELSPEKYGYSITPNEGWKNSLYGTDYQSCNKMHRDVMTYYINHAGGSRYGSHMIASLLSHGYTIEQLLRGASKRDLTVSVHARFEAYVTSLLALDDDD